MLAAYERYSAPGGGSPAFATVLFVPGLVLFVAALRELRGQGTSSHIGWLNIAAGVALLTEWGVSISEGAKLVQPSLLAGALSLALGILHGKIQRVRRARRRIEIDDLGIRSWLNPFRRLRVEWSDLRSVSLEPDTIAFETTAGARRRLPLRRLNNADQVTAAIVDACRAHGVTVRGAIPASTAVATVR